MSVSVSVSVGVSVSGRVPLHESSAQLGTSLTRVQWMSVGDQKMRSSYYVTASLVLGCALGKQVSGMVAATFLYTRVWVYGCVYARVGTHVCGCTGVCTHVWVRTCVDVRMWVDACVWVCGCKMRLVSFPM
jgi:hypothetical protein